MNPLKGWFFSQTNLKIYQKPHFCQKILLFLKKWGKNRLKAFDFFYKSNTI